MDKSFSNFCNEESKKRTKEECKQGVSEQDLRERYDELKDLNSEELTSRLYEEVRKQKQNETFDYEGLCENIERLRMFIPAQTYENMKAMLGRLK